MLKIPLKQNTKLLHQAVKTEIYLNQSAAFKCHNKVWYIQTLVSSIVSEFRRASAIRVVGQAPSLDFKPRFSAGLLTTATIQLRLVINV